MSTGYNIVDYLGWFHVKVLTILFKLKFNSRRLNHYFEARTHFKDSHNSFTASLQALKEYLLVAHHSLLSLQVEHVLLRNHLKLKAELSCSTGRANICQLMARYQFLPRLTTLCAYEVCEWVSVRVCVCVFMYVCPFWQPDVRHYAPEMPKSQKPPATRGRQHEMMRWVHIVAISQKCQLAADVDYVWEQSRAV